MKLSCMKSNEDFVSIHLFCGHEEILEIEEVSLWRAKSDGLQCRSLNRHNVSPLPCQGFENDALDGIWGRCPGHNGCEYQFEYPDADDCPESSFLPYRAIELRIVYECVPGNYIYSALLQ